ncbi:MAG TPA: DNA translocase FtsK [Verrucomicrobiae bacterium]
MARKDPASQTHHGWHDVIGIVLISLSLLLFVAFFSFDAGDLSVNRRPPNPNYRNWIGPVGAHLANWSFFVFGAAAFIGPVLLLGFGLAHLLQLLAYLRRRWVWALVLFVSCMGMLDLYTSAFGAIRRNLNAPSAGGFIGMTMNNVLFGKFGTVGATIIFTTLYVISLMFLTNFQFGEWFRRKWAEKFGGELPEDEEASARLSPEERALARKERELKQEADRLRKQLDKAEREKGKRDEGAPQETGPKVGADMQPIPEPTVTDLSVPQPKLRSTVKKGDAKPEPSPVPAPATRVIQPPDEVEVISATEIAAASTAEVLGKEPPKKAEELKPADAKADEPKPAGAPVEPMTITDNSGSLQPAAVAAPAEAPPRPRPAPKKPRPLSVASTPQIGNYQLPGLDLLNHPDTTVVVTETKEQLMDRARLMQQTLAQFEIEVSLGDITKGPTITRYELHPAPGVKLEKITALSNNIAAALKAERIHILAPVPGKSSVGVEVPNTIKTKVIMRDLLESEDWKNTKARVPLALGKDVYGHQIIADLGDMPHLLIAGSTGSGKSVCINSIVTSLLYKFSPDQLRFVMIDPKVVELQQYNALPHLVVPVVTDPKKVILALRWVVNEMEKRYQIFAKVGVRNITSFNSRPKDKQKPQTQPELPLSAKKEKIEANADGFAVEVDEEMVAAEDETIVIPEKLSYIVVIIDELADLMLVAPADVEMAIARITQMARAAGIHCIVATQRPSVDVITGVIKANIPARIAFQVASRVDSRTILDAMGADKLLGKGDMLYLPPGSAKLIRAQGALITDEEINKIVKHVADQGKPSYEMEIHQALQKAPSSMGAGFEQESGTDEDESLIEQCIEVIRSEQKASVSLLQRRLRLGYTRAARIMDELENRGIVGPSKGAEPRDILIDLDGTGADGRESGAPSTAA